MTSAATGSTSQTASVTVLLANMNPPIHRRGMPSDSRSRCGSTDANAVTNANRLAENIATYTRNSSLYATAPSA